MTNLSCGHSIKNNKYSVVSVKGWTKEGKRSVKVKNLCNKCKRDYLVNGLILSTEKEIKDWFKMDKNNIKN